MTQNSPTDQTRTGPVGDLDRLLADFFKSQLRHPWPPPPHPAPVEVSTIIAAQLSVGEASLLPRTQRDAAARSRFTLAASVALLLGTCWYISDGFRPGRSPSPVGPNSGILGKAEASNPPALGELRKEKALKEKATPRPPVKLP